MAADLSTKLAQAATDAPNGIAGTFSIEDLIAGDTPGAIASNPAADNGLYATPVRLVELPQFER